MSVTSRWTSSNLRTGAMNVDRGVTYGIIFFGAIFFALTISNAGMFLNDEWVTGSQLDQLNRGHQIVYNEGKYGYHENGTISNYFERRDNVLMYSMALPVIAFPVLKLVLFCAAFDMVRVGIVLAWLVSFLVLYAGLGFVWFNRFDSNRSATVTFSSITRTIVRYSWTVPIAMAFLAECMILTGEAFPVIGDRVPVEILAIVLTNVILFGIFAVTVKGIAERVFTTDPWMQWVGTIAAIGCSSILFWIGTCKDHVLTITASAIILYLILEYAATQNRHHLYGAAFGVGLLAWIRPDVAIGAGLAVAVIMVYFHRDAWHQLPNLIGVCSIATAIGAVPMLINNIIVTGNPVIHPFMLANAEHYGGSVGVATAVAWTQPWVIELQNITRTCLLPSSGAASLALICPLVVVMGLVFIPHLIDHLRNWTNPFTRTEGILLIFGITSLLYYIVRCGSGIHADTGIVPDIRYYSVGYVPFIFVALSLMVRHYRPNAIAILRNVAVFAGILTVLMVVLVATIPSVGASYQSYTTVANIIAVQAIVISTLILLQCHAPESRRWVDMIVAGLIALPLSWQLTITVVYSSVKMHAYPMLIPATEWMYNLIFV